ncbi:MAG: PilN domain-containing protein [Actinobacteria bacterium]|nr:PilN domain-containing protein [Actinomycetota bacterium]
MAAVGVVAIIIGAYLFQILRLHGVQNDLKAQTATNDSLRAQLHDLGDFEALNQELKSKTSLISGLTADEVRWSVVLSDVSLVIPPETWLTGFSGSVSAPAVGSAAAGANAAAGASAPSLGTIQMNGTTFTHLDVAVWLTRLNQIDAFTLPYVTLSAKASLDGTAIVNFNSSVQLSSKAFRTNQSGAQRKI